MQLRERDLWRATKGVIVVFHLTLAGMMPVGMAHAQQNTCPYLNDGDCDEPEGLGLCAEGTDVADCSNPNSNYGSGIGYTGGGSGVSVGGGTCPYINDGDCDEPEGLGLCAEGTDVADCSNPNSNYGSGIGYTGGRSGVSVGRATERYTYAPWAAGNFQSQFNHPGGVYPVNIIYDPSVRNGPGFYAGDYDIYLADGGANGNGPYTGVARYTVTLQPNTIYTLDLNQIFTNPTSLLMNTNRGLAIPYGEPGEGRATMYVNNSNTTDWRAICILPTGAPFTVCEGAVDLPDIIELFGETPHP